METEKKTLRKWILLILVLLIPITAVLVALRISQAASREKEMNRLKMEMVSELLNNAEDRRKVATDWFLENIEVNLSLMAVALQEFLTEDGYEGPRSFEDGVVIEVRDNEILYPDDKPANCPEVTMEMLKDGLYKEASTSTVVDLRSDDGDESSDDEPEDNRVSINFAEIGNGFYYVDWTSVQEYEEYIGRYTETEDLLAAVEKALNIGILVVDTDTKDLKLLSPSGFFPNAVCAAELGITHEDLNAEGSLIRIGGRLFHCSYQTLPHLGKNLIYLSPFTATVLHSIGTAMMTVTVILLLLVTVGTWILSVRRYVRRTDISRNMETLHMYRPRRLRIRAFAAGLTGTVVIFLFALIFQSLSAMQSETENARETINVLFNQLQERERQQIQKSKDLETDWFVYYGRRLASLIGEYPQVGTPENLDYYCLMTGADYIMLFDTKGQETVCSDGFTGLKLDSAFGENSADFMKLLNGVTSVVHEPAVDSLTGLTRQIVGVCLPQEKGYGALIMSIQPGWTQRLDMDEDLNTRLAILTPKGRQCFAAEKEGGLIRYASTDSMIGSTVENCGLSADTLRDSYTDFVTLNNVRSYAVTTEMDPLICYCSTETRYLFSKIWAYAIVSALASALALLATTRFLLKDYTDTQFEDWARTEDAPPPAPPETPAPQRGKRSLLFWLRRAWDTFWKAVKKSLHWDEAGPEQRTGIIFRLSLFLLMLICAAYVSYLSRTTSSGNSILLFILNGNWMRGFNLFALCSILILCGGAYLFMSVLRYFLKLISSFTGRRGETICRLLGSVMQYAVLIAVVYFSFSYLGFSPGAIVASVGVTALVVTLGARDMVTDMFAGIFIVLEDQFQVGDIVSIEDYRGVVKEIGIRSVKILGLGGDIRIFSNSAIRNVINKSHYMSTCYVDIRIAATEPFSHVKEIMDRELPAIGARCDKIIGTPVFIGVTNLAGFPGTITVGISAKCKEEDFLQVSRTLNSELVLLCEREHIEVR
ncbi:MAG: mechanosensitive ion channel family protein [Oscillospiraceae bacterium]|nr:mechanosensitive ion channel family protein [Oscillospiraceae bacterium]